MNGLRRILFVSFVLMSVSTWVFPVLAEHVSVRASRGDDFGRIVFLWDRPVSHKMAHNGRTLTIRFGRPIEASYQRVLGALRKYINRVRTNRDGRSVTFQLSGAFEAFVFDSGNAVIVEIADLLEQIAYNALPAAFMNGTMWSLNYFQQVNKLDAIDGGAKCEHG